MANSLRRIRLAGGVAAVVVLAAATILAAIAGAAPGDLDASFGGDGIVTTNLGGDDVIRGAALQADGKLVVAGYTDDSTLSRFAVARYLANGGLDTSFAGDGIQVTSFPSTPSAGRFSSSRTARSSWPATSAARPRAISPSPGTTPTAPSTPRSPTTGS